MDSYDRNRREKRRTRKAMVAPELKGMISKAKKKREPGYKNKIKRAIKKNEQQRRKIERRQEMRAARRANKQKNSF